jgi:hypothetical protein
MIYSPNRQLFFMNAETELPVAATAMKTATPMKASPTMKAAAET